MKISPIDDALSKLKEVKNGSYPQEELSGAVSIALETIFKETCSKPYLQHCEPDFCTFKSKNMCEYANEFSRLKSIIKQSIE